MYVCFIIFALKCITDLEHKLISRGKNSFLKYNLAGYSNTLILRVVQTCSAPVESTKGTTVKSTGKGYTRPTAGVPVPPKTCYMYIKHQIAQKQMLKKRNMAKCLVELKKPSMRKLC